MHGYTPITESVILLSIKEEAERPGQQRPLPSRDAKRLMGGTKPTIYPMSVQFDFSGTRVCGYAIIWTQQTSLTEVSTAVLTVHIMSHRYCWLTMPVLYI